jgi:peptidoglycan/LPS O-acetylase OafA/YrhL
MSEIKANKRLLHLEATRGIASIIVVFHHFLLGFFPILKESIVHGGWKFTPLYMLINGSGAVVFFFLLSGFVLTTKFYQNFLIKDFVASIIKRLPRLMLPASISMMIGAAILIYYYEAYGAAAQLTGSDWLAAFANGRFPENFAPSFLDAAKDSLLVFFFKGHYHYNSNLWTMFYEFYGSIIVFALVAIAIFRFRSGRYSVIILHMFLALICIINYILFLPFVIGSLISFIQCRQSVMFKLSPWAVIMLVVTMIVGYSFDSWYALILASTAAMILLLGVSSLEQKLSGPIGLFLGRLSFPLYLVHVLVILSVTSTAYTALAEYGLPRWGVLILCLVVTCTVSLLAALPFMAVEKFWVSTLNRWSRAVVARFMS